MMKYVALATLVLSLSGCYQTVNDWDIEEAQKKCSDHGGIAQIRADILGTEYVTCRDNTGYRLHWRFS